MVETELGGKGESVRVNAVGARWFIDRAIFYLEGDSQTLKADRGKVQRAQDHVC